MPKFGMINERRHQLHEVIRLSGMNMIINDIDQPLIIKVASLPNDRLQVYFIDNEEYFKRKFMYEDKGGKMFEDNDERSIFFIKGILATIKKLNWKPDVIHCQGWMTALMPLYLKKYYEDDAFFDDIKMVYSIYDKPFDGLLGDKTVEKVLFDGFEESDVEKLKEPTYLNLLKTGVDYADAIVQGDEVLPQEIMDYIKSSEKEFKEHQTAESLSMYYPTLVNEEEED